MQYRNLNLDKLQAFAPERKLIDKENIYNAFMGLGDVLQKGADAYTLNKIYQLSPEEQQRKMAEYRAYKGDFSGFDNIEQAKLRKAEMDALREQQRIDKEQEAIATERANENSYYNLISNRNALFSELQKRMKEYNDVNATTTKYNNIHDLETQKRFLENEDTSLLKEFIENTNQLNNLNYNKKVADVSIDDVFKYDVNMNKNIQSDEIDTNKIQDTNIDSRDATKVIFNTDKKRDDYLSNENIKAGLTDPQKDDFKPEYIDKRYKKHNQKTIIDDNISDLEKEKLKDLGYDVITQEDSNKRKQDSVKKETEKNVANEIKSLSSIFGQPPKGRSNKEIIDWAKKEVENNKYASDALNKILNKYKYKSEGK